MLSGSQNQNSVEVRDIISVVCQAGYYKSGDMKTCQTCGPGNAPNSDKTACGKITLLTVVLNCRIKYVSTFFVAMWKKPTLG